MLIITTVDVVPAFAAMTTGNASRCGQLKVTSASASLSLFHVDGGEDVEEHHDNSDDELDNNKVLTSCQPHRVTSVQSNSVISCLVVV